MITWGRQPVKANVTECAAFVAAFGDIPREDGALTLARLVLNAIQQIAGALCKRERRPTLPPNVIHSSSKAPRIQTP